MDCVVCASYSKTYPIECMYCHEKVCQECYQTGILLDTHEPRCLFCKKPLSIEAIMKNTPRSWVVNKFFPHLTSIRMESEKNLLIHDQSEARLLIMIQTYRDALRRMPTISKLRKRLKLKTGSHPEIETIRKTRHDLQQKIREMSSSSFAKKKTTPAKWKGFCPLNNCRGFISSDGICGLCQAKSCVMCGEKDHQPDECDPDILKNFTAIVNETKPCPCCSVSIYQMSGCDQMWCVLCHTTFSWKTGEVLKGMVHNPHYYEWLFNTTNNRRDIHLDPCGEIPDAMTYLDHMRYHQFPHIGLYSQIHRTLNHMQHVVLPSMHINRVPSNKELRIRYLIKDINEKRWHHLLQVRERRRLKLNSLYQITETVVQVLSDMIRKSIQSPDHDAIHNEIEQFRQYIKSQYQSVCDIHGGGLPESLRSTMLIFH